MGYLRKKLFKKPPHRSPYSETGGSSYSRTTPPIGPSRSTSEPSPSPSSTTSTAGGAFDPLFACGWLLSMPNISSFDAHTLTIATNKFSAANKLGEGGFGSVYKGRLNDGTPIAVKKLDHGSMQGDQEFMTEVSILNSLKHPNIIRLYGVCVEEQNRMCVFNLGACSLHEQLHVSGAGHPVLSWQQRLNILLGIASGLVYLHQAASPPVAHCDVSARNILLMRDCSACLADFGLATDLPQAGQGSVSVSEVRSTFGYIAPEVASKGAMSAKADVYSFGVLILEVVTGQLPVDTSRKQGQQDLVEWLQPLLGDANAMQANLDPRLPGGRASCPLPHLALLCEVAAACLRHDPKERLRMREAADQLQMIHVSLQSSAPTPSSRLQKTPGESAAPLRNISGGPSSGLQNADAAPRELQRAGGPTVPTGRGTMSQQSRGLERATAAAPSTAAAAATLPCSSSQPPSTPALDPFDPLGTFNNPFLSVSTRPSIQQGQPQGIQGPHALPSMAQQHHLIELEAGVAPTDASLPWWQVSGNPFLDDPPQWGEAPTPMDVQESAAEPGKQNSTIPIASEPELTTPSTAVLCFNPFEDALAEAEPCQPQSQQGSTRHNGHWNPFQNSPLSSSRTKDSLPPSTGQQEKPSPAFGGNPFCDASFEDGAALSETDSALRTGIWSWQQGQATGAAEHGGVADQASCLSELPLPEHQHLPPATLRIPVLDAEQQHSANGQQLQPPPPPAGLSQPNATPRSLDTLCLLCFSEVRNQRLEPCGHVAVCRCCGPALESVAGPCPVCSARVAGTIYTQPRHGRKVAHPPHPSAAVVPLRGRPLGDNEANTEQLVISRAQSHYSPHVTGVA